MPLDTLGLACVLGDAALLLDTLCALAAEAVRGTSVAGRDVGDETSDAPIDAIPRSLEPAAPTSAVIVETEPEKIELIPANGASTADDWVAVTSGIVVVSLCEKDIGSDGSDIVSIEWSEPKGCEAPICLGLTAYRTTATPAAVPMTMVSIVSNTILPDTPDEKSLQRVICDGVKGIIQSNQNAAHRARSFVSCMQILISDFR